MKYILTLLSLVSFVAYGQEPAYTPMRLSYQFRTIKVDSLFLIPSFNDTTAANNSTMKNVAGAMIRTGNDFYMRNATTNAWLQNVNVGTGASPSIQFVDSVWRVAGKDSIFWRKGGTTNKIKDSTVTDSPDRIDGTATANVTSAFANYRLGLNTISKLTIQSDTAEYTHNTYSLVSGDGYQLYGNNMALSTSGSLFKIDNFPSTLFSLDSSGNFIINASDSIRLKNNNIEHLTKGNKYEFKDFNNTFLRIDTLGNFEAGDITSDNLHIKLTAADSAFKIQSKAPSTWREKNSGLTSQVKTGYADNGIDLSVADYNILLPGVYIILDATVNSIKLPDAANWKGQSFQIVNLDGGNNAALAAFGGQIFDRGTGNNLSAVTAARMAIFYSDGADWYGFEL